MRTFLYSRGGFSSVGFFSPLARLPRRRGFFAGASSGAASSSASSAGSS